MKTSTISAIALLLLSAGCSFLEDDIHLGSPHGRNPHSRVSRTDATGSLAENASASRYDTVVYVTAVAYQDGYDWQRDSASGHVPARIVLFRDGIETVSVPVGDGRASADLDLHHIVDGRLYTEYTGYSGTSLWCDGEFVCRSDAREYLKGIVRRGDVTYTLSCPCGGSGYSLRRNGEGVLVRNSGNVFGDFSDPSYGMNGALYEVSGKVCFAGREESGRVVSIVRDGVEEKVDVSGRITDVKVKERGCAMTDTEELGLYWGDGTRLWLMDDGVWQTGDIGWDIVPEWLYAESWATGGSFAVPLTGASVYLSDKALAAVSWSQSGTVTVGMSGRENRTIDGSWRYISDKCAALAGDRLYLALSAMDPGMHPVLVVGDKVTELPVNGFATEIRIKTEQICL